MHRVFGQWGGLGWLVVVVLTASPAQAGGFCLAAAETYYQQLYCEIKARGAGGTLPGFADFKRNNPTVQALLLKRPARRLGIEVVMPKGGPAREIARVESRPKSLGTTVPPVAAESKETRRPTSIPEQASRDCALLEGAIRCGADRYRLVGNQHNRELGVGALEHGNRMELPVYRASLSDARALNRYLLQAYRRYLEKMLAIGLGGVTMSYAKFANLHRDLSARGVDFAQRFETMYKFLKQDKRKLAVSTRVPGSGALRLSDCGDVSETLIACSAAGRNYVYRRIN